MLRPLPGSCPPAESIPEFPIAARDRPGAHNYPEPSAPRARSRDSTRERCLATDFREAPASPPDRTPEDSFDSGLRGPSGSATQAAEYLRGARAAEADESRSCSGGIKDPGEN